MIMLAFAQTRRSEPAYGAHSWCFGFPWNLVYRIKSDARQGIWTHLFQPQGIAWTQIANIYASFVKLNFCALDISRIWHEILTGCERGSPDCDCADKQLLNNVCLDGGRELLTLVICHQSQLLFAGYGTWVLFSSCVHWRLFLRN